MYISVDHFTNLEDVVLSFLEYHGFRHFESVDEPLYLLLDEVHMLLRAFKKKTFRPGKDNVVRVFGRTTEELFVDYLLEGALERSFLSLLHYLASNVPGPLSYEKISSMTGIPKFTAEKYLDCLTLEGLLLRVEHCRRNATLLHTPS